MHLLIINFNFSSSKEQGFSFFMMVFIYFSCCLYFLLKESFDSTELCRFTRSMRGWNSRMNLFDITSAIISVRSLKQFSPRISMKYGFLENLKGFEITISSSNFKSFFFYSSSFYFSLYFSNELYSSSFIELNEKQEKGVIALFKDRIDLKTPKEFCKPKINILSN